MSISSSSISGITLILAGGFMLGVGTYTENGGIQLAGFILIMVSLKGIFNQTRGSNNSE